VELLRAEGAADSARAAAQAAVDALPDSPALRVALAGALLDLGRAREARREAERALALAPGDPAAASALGIALKAEGRAGQGEAAFRAAAAAAPRAVEPRLNLALLYHERGAKCAPAPHKLDPGARRDEMCPVSTRGGTRRVHLVREGGGGRAGWVAAGGRAGWVGRGAAMLALALARILPLSRFSQRGGGRGVSN